MMETLDLVHWSEALLRYLGRTALGHTALLLALFAVAKVLRRHGPRDRHFVGLCWLIGLILVAIWPLALGRLELPVLPTQQTAVRLGRSMGTERDAQAGGAEAVVSESKPAPRAPSAQSRQVSQTVPVAMESAHLGPGARESVASLCAGLYLLVVAVLLSHLVVATLLVARVVRRGGDATDPALAALFDRVRNSVAPRSRVTLKLCDTVRLPATLGLIRHWVLLPRGAAAQLSAGDLERVLMHELAHVRRNDFAVNLLQQIVKRTAFFNPLVWAFDRWLRNEREQACDEFVLAQIPDAGAYAECLTRLLVPEQRRVAGLIVTAGVLGFASSVRIRVAAVLGGQAVRAGASRLTKAGLASAMATLVFATCGVSLVSRPAALAQEAAEFGKPLNELLARLGGTKRTREDVARLFGPPEKYVWHTKVFDEARLPELYLMCYDKRQVHFWMVEGVVYEVRIHGPEYTFEGSLRVGSPIEDVISAYGPGLRQVHGEDIDGPSGVLYRDARSWQDGRPVKGFAYLVWPEKRVRIFLGNDRIRAIYLLSERAVADFARLSEGRSKLWPLNDLLRKLEAAGRTRAALVELFGKPDRKGRARNVLPDEDVPDAEYVAYIAPFTMFFLEDGKVEQVRIRNRSYELQGGIRVGSSLDAVVERLGRRPREVQGGVPRPEAGVLFRRPFGKLGRSRLYLRADRAWLEFRGDTVCEIILCAPEKGEPRAASENAGRTARPLVDMFAELEQTQRRRADLERVFGKPVQDKNGTQTYGEGGLPAMYFMRYDDPRVKFYIWDGAVYSAFVEDPAFALDEAIRVGSTFDEVATAYGEGLRQVRGGWHAGAPDVLYRDVEHGYALPTRGRKVVPGTGYLLWPAKRAQLHFQNGRVRYIILLSEKSLIDELRRHEGMTKRWPLNEMFAKLDEAGWSRKGVVQVFGEPYLYQMHSRIYREDRLPKKYNISYLAPSLRFSMNGDRVRETRIRNPGYRVLGDIGLGSRLSDVLERLGTEVEVVHGKSPYPEPNVLFREPHRLPNTARLYLEKERAWLRLVADVVREIVLPERTAQAGGAG